MTRWVELYSPGSAPIRHELFDSNLAVGTGSDADLRVPTSTGLAGVHFWVTANDAGVTVEIVESIPVGLHFEGKEGRSIVVPWGSEVFVGNTRMAFLEGSTSISSKGTTLLLASALILGVAGIGMYKFSSIGLPSEPSSDAPVLNYSGDIQCPDGVAADAEHAARENERAAQAKQQRFPFDPRDGVEAVDNLRISEACYQAAGRADEASRTHADTERWSHWVNSEYSTVRLRLKYDLEHEQFADALRRIDEIRTFLGSHGGGEYGQWLAQTRETLLRRLAPSQ